MSISDTLNGKKDNPPKSNVSAKGMCVVGRTAQCNYGQGLRNMDLGRLASGLRVRGPVTAKRNTAQTEAVLGF